MQKKSFSTPEFTAEPTFEELAAQQGVVPVRDFESLLGKPVPGDESVEEFQVMLGAWRSEGTKASE